MDYLFPCSLSYFYPIHGVACFHHSRSDEDTIRDIMADAIRSAKQRITKAASYMEHIDPFLFSVIHKQSEDPTTSKEGADNTLDNANNDYERNAKMENKSPLPALLATAPALNDSSLGCGEKVICRLMVLEHLQVNSLHLKKRFLLKGRKIPLT